MLDANQVFPNRVAGVIRSQDAGAAYHACLAAVRGGIGTVEVTTGVPDWAEVVRRLVAEAGPTPVGVGTVVEPAMVAANARHAHMEMGDVPIVDHGAYVMLGNDELFLQMLARGAELL